MQWSVRSDTKNDLVDIEGSVDFLDGETTGDIEIKIRGDKIPELDERFTIMLTSVTQVDLCHSVDICYSG